MRPYGLFVKGELPNPNAPAVAIIGARRCTHHGGIIAEHTAAELTRAGILIISGLAIGIDSCSHQGALSAGGKTYAVMGCGPDICYPSSHRNLYEQIASHGGILSEYPPGREVRPAYFPLRNRIISGLADLVLVVEARERSGSLITVDQALEQGREVMAVPGRPDDPLSVGCNRLIPGGCSHLHRIVRCLPSSRSGSEQPWENFCRSGLLFRFCLRTNGRGTPDSEDPDSRTSSHRADFSGKWNSGSRSSPHSSPAGAVRLRSSGYQRTFSEDHQLICDILSHL